MIEIEDYIKQAATMIHDEESKIDDSKELYLITWSPDPSKLPDADAHYQHIFNINLLIDYLQFCGCGIFVHEFTQKGNPHYHGWYQVDSSRELGRVALVKVLDKFGNTNITKVISCYKINNYSRARNALGYYKKETFDKVIAKNPITKDTEPDDTNWSTKLFFFNITKGRHTVNDLLDHISNKKYYTDFYKKSD